MTEQSKTWRATTRTWSVSSDTPEARDAGTGQLIGVSEQWRYESSDDDGDGPFSVEINNGAVTVNGRHYGSLDAVPRAERERIEAVRDSLSGDGLLSLLRQAGVDTRVLGAAAVRDNPAKPDFIIETDIPDVRAAATPGQLAPPPTPMDAGSAAPGAVPQSGGLRRIVLIAVALGLAWAALRLSGVV